MDAPEEPSLAVDPRDPRHLVAAWQQDRRPNGAAYGAAVAVSRDGGATWRETMLPRLTRCAGGGPYELVSDTWTSIGPDGAAYVGALTISPRGGRFDSSIVVSASRDGGTAWGAPVVAGTAAAGEAVLDKPSILADPRKPGRVLAVWARFRLTGASDQVALASSEDHGATWSAPATIYDAGSEAQFNTLLAAQDGALLEVFSEGRPLDAGRPARVAAMRSTDGGATWSAPVTVASFTATQAVDPEGGGKIRAFGEAVSAAAAPGGHVYVAWFEDHAGDTSAVRVSGSADGGRTWDPPAAVVQEPAQPFLPALAVAGDGTVAVTWYDLRHAAAGPGLGTEVWTAVSRDHGLTWRELRLDRPFDLRLAPAATGEGLFIGDYEGLAGLPAGFAAAYVRTPAGGAQNRTEVAFVRFASTPPVRAASGG
ncbi:MAG TPA: hypothetical protein VOB72_26880 [Candidatus Dormibacteraeota bacterium]|nr:hypothetical protein [Candidatus Dormibacteraeota bacterium]